MATYSLPKFNNTQLAASNTQVGASGSEDGPFTYNPVEGTVLGAGQGQTLSVSFTPTDTANYTTATVTNIINVSQYPASIFWPPIANITYPIPLSGTQLNAVAN